MYCRIIDSIRAPFGLVRKEVSKIENQYAATDSCSELNERIISTLHHYHWRKPDYLRELRRHSKASASMGPRISTATGQPVDLSFNGKPWVYCFKR